MKKLLMVVAILMTGVCTAMAQDVETKWEAQIGFNSSKFTNFSSKPGFHIGVNRKYELPKLLENSYLNVGMLLSLEGSKFDLGDLGGSKTTAGYLKVPVHIGYIYSFNDKIAAFGEFGPYFSVGLFGKHKTEELDYDKNGKPNTVETSYNTFDVFKHLDFGLGIKFGVEYMKKYTLAFGYDFGFIDLYRKSMSGEDDSSVEDGSLDLTPSTKNRNLYISIGYKF